MEIKYNSFIDYYIMGLKDNIKQELLPSFNGLEICDYFILNFKDLNYSLYSWLVNSSLWNPFGLYQIVLGYDNNADTGDLADIMNKFKTRLLIAPSFKTGNYLLDWLVNYFSRFKIKDVYLSYKINDSDIDLTDLIYIALYENHLQTDNNYDNLGFNILTNFYTINNEIITGLVGSEVEEFFETYKPNLKFRELFIFYLNRHKEVLNNFVKLWKDETYFFNSSISKNTGNITNQAFANEFNINNVFDQQKQLMDTQTKNINTNNSELFLNFIEKNKVVLYPLLKDLERLFLVYV